MRNGWRGAVTLDSVAGAGTTVTLYLPRVRDSDASADAEIAAHASVPPGLRVLMVEDDGEVRAVVNRFLAALACEVTPCIDAEQALAALESGAAFDLLLTDVALGAGMRGTELAKRVQQRWPKLPVILMTGFASAVASTPPGFDVLRKPYTRAELARAIAKAVSAVQ